MKANIVITVGVTIIATIFAMETAMTSSQMKSNQNTNLNTDYIVLGMGCFWGAEKRMGEIPGVIDVESGYAGGDFSNVGYQQILNHEKSLRAGKTTERNYAEVIKVIFNPAQVTLQTVLMRFWENHNPTQGDRQGNDIGSNYRSAIYYQNETQKDIAFTTQNIYQQALHAAGYGAITTEILPLKKYIAAEEYHQDYLNKNPNGYCGLGGTGVKYPSVNHGIMQDNAQADAGANQLRALAGKDLNFAQQLVIFEAENCEFCKQFDEDILNHWQAEVPVIATMNASPPAGWELEKPLFAAPTIVLFRNGKEVARYTGYNGEKTNFWKWLGFQLLSPEQQRIAFQQGTEPPFTASNLDEKRPGRFVDPLTGATLFLSKTKFDSRTGWPSFFDPIEGSVTLHEDNSQGMKRIEVRSASSGIHLGHVFNDGPAPSYKRYCINGNVLKFIPD
jgi:peptide methionine sulfoxide reductase msrA/msrB